MGISWQGIFLWSQIVIRNRDIHRINLCADDGMSAEPLIQQIIRVYCRNLKSHQPHALIAFGYKRQNSVEVYSWRYPLEDANYLRRSVIVILEELGSPIGCNQYHIAGALVLFD